MPMFEDSGVSYANSPAQTVPQYEGGDIDVWNRLCAQRINVMTEQQLELASTGEPQERTIQSIADEVFSRLMLHATNKENSVADRVAALEGAWRVSADFARLSGGE